MSDSRRIGLIGDPVEHSLSPFFQQPALDSLGLDIRYELWPTPLAALPGRLDDLRAGRALGANVTVPHKEAVFAAMDDVSDLALRAGAVNTIVPRNGRLFGDNTDIHGFVVPLREREVRFEGLDAIVLGAGGAARGIVVALLNAGVRRIHVLNRTIARAEHLAATLGDDRVRSATSDQAQALASDAGLIVNATSIGWQGHDLPLDPAAFGVMPPAAIAYDLTYRETPYLPAARAAGLATIDGFPLLVQQGARSFELWTGQPAPIDILWSAALAARAARGG